MWSWSCPREAANRSVTSCRRLLLDGVTLVISPLIALMKDQVDGLVQNQVPATFINSALTPSEQGQRLREIQQGRYKLVYIAPERFRNPGIHGGDSILPRLPLCR